MSLHGIGEAPHAFSLRVEGGAAELRDAVVPPLATILVVTAGGVRVVHEAALHQTLQGTVQIGGVEAENELEKILVKGRGERREALVEAAPLPGLPVIPNVRRRVGRCLAELAGRHQVLCITHLPQIAAYATTHFRVDKREQDGRSLARIRRVEGRERVEEIARMAGGEEIGEATRRHARDLIRTRSAL